MILTESLFLMRQLCLKWLEKPVYIKKCKHERKQGCGRLSLLWAFPFYFPLLFYVGSQSPLYLSTRILTGVQLRSKTYINVCCSWCRLSVVFIETPCRPPPSPPPPWSGSTCQRRKIIHPHGLRHPRMRAQRGFYRCTREPAHHISPYVAMLSWMTCIQGVFNLSFKTLNVNTLNVKHP